MRRVALGLVGGVLLLAGAGQLIAADEDRRHLGGEAEAPKELSKEELATAAKPTLVLTSGGHTAAVSRVLFTPDARQVLTVSHDKTIRFWDVETGQTVRVLRTPAGPGAVGDLLAGALSPDGKTLAVAGWGHVENRERVVGVYLIALPGGGLRTLKGHTDAVECLAFSADGKRLASGSQDRTIRIWDVATGECVQTLHGHREAVMSVAFAPARRRLVSVSLDRTGRIWSLEKGKEEAVLEGHTGMVLAAAWSPDGRTIVTGGRDEKGLRVWNADGTLRKVLEVGGAGTVVHDLTLKWGREGREVLYTWRTPREKEGYDIGASFADLGSGKSRPALEAQASAAPTLVRVALSADHKLGALSGGNRHQTRLWTVGDGKEVHRLEGRGRPRLSAGWGTAKEEPVIAWGSPRRADDAHPPLAASFRFAELSLSVRRLREGRFKGEWHENERERLSVAQTAPRVLKVKEGAKEIATVRLPGPIECFTLLPGGKLAVATGFFIHLFEARTGTHVQRFLPHRGRVTALAPSPDGKYLLSASVDQTVRVNVMGQHAPLVTLFVANNEWVAWTPQGYYAASAGGERLMGWQVNHGPHELATFYQARQFRQALHRPDVIQRLLAAGSVAKALEEADQARGVKQRGVVEIEEVLPPKVTLTALKVQDLKLTKPELEVEAQAQGGKQGVTALQLLLDGRPYPGAHVSFKGAKPGAAVKAKWTIQVPEGEHTLRAIGRTEAGMGLSEDLEVTYEHPAPKPKLYLVAVGIDAYKDARLRLTCAVSDAKELAKTFRARSEPLFDIQPPVLLTDSKATRQGILQGLRGLRANMKPLDVAVIFYAGHGEQDGKSFYLLPQDVDVKDLKKTGISGEVLKEELAHLPGKVLLLLDACHSGAIGRAINDIARDLADEDCGVIVLCAALGSETAREDPVLRHGYFCQSMLEALNGAPKAPRNPRDGCVYLHHLEQYVIDRVQELSKDEQHPTSARPAIRPFAVAKP